MYPVFNVGYLLETWDNSCGVTWVIFLYLQSSSRVQESTEHLLAFDISDTSPIGSKKETWQATNVIFKGLTIWLHLVFLVVLGVCVWVMVWHTRNHTNTWHLWQVKWSSRPVEVVSVWLLSGATCQHVWVSEASVRRKAGNQWRGEQRALTLKQTG